MDELLTNLETEKLGLWIVLFMGLSSLIKSIFELTKEWMANELRLRQKLRHEKLNKHHQIDLARHDAKIKAFAGVDTAKDVNRVDDILDEIRTNVNAKRVIIDQFHNGVNKHFRNYSTRYESRDDTIQSNYVVSKPLKSFHSEIEKFSTNEYLEYTINSENASIKLVMNDASIKHMLVFPILLHPDETEYDHQRIYAIQKEDNPMYILGVITIQGNKLCTKDICIEQVKRGIAEIINIYLNNNAVFG